MQILVFILKILGFTVLGILGLALFLLLLVMFWPVGYQAKASYHGQPYVRVDVGWLFRMLHLKLLYENGELTKKLTLFGFPLKKREKKPKKGKKQKKEKKTKKEKKNKKAESKSKKEAGQSDVTPDIRQSGSQKVEPQQSGSQKVEQQQSEPQQADYAQAEKPQLEGSPFSDSSGQTGSGNNKFFERVKKVRKKIQSFFQKIPLIFKRFIKKIKDIKAAIQKLFHKLGGFYGFLTLEENKTSFGYIWNIVKILLKHCGPRKVKGIVKFGMEDPCTTGEILGVMSIFYGRYAESIRIIPDFEQKCLDADLKLRGHMQLGIIGIHALRVLFSSEFRSLKYNFDQLKEDS